MIKGRTNSLHVNNFKLPPEAIKKDWLEGSIELVRWALTFYTLGGAGHFYQKSSSHEQWEETRDGYMKTLRKFLTMFDSEYKEENYPVFPATRKPEPRKMSEEEERILNELLGDDEDAAPKEKWPEKQVDNFWENFYSEEEKKTEPVKKKTKKKRSKKTMDKVRELWKKSEEKAAQAAKEPRFPLEAEDADVSEENTIDVRTETQGQDLKAQGIGLQLPHNPEGGILKVITDDKTYCGEPLMILMNMQADGWAEGSLKTC
jgi:hypothetical protein